MARDWLDTGNHGIAVGLEYGSVVDSVTRGAITADTVNAEVSNLEVWVKTNNWTFTDTNNHLSVSGSAVTDDSWSNLNAGTSSSKKLKELNPQANALQYNNPVTRACTVSLSGIEAAGETLSGTHNFTFPARPYHVPSPPTVGLDANYVHISGNQNDPAQDRYWQFLDVYYSRNDAAWVAVLTNYLGSGTDLNLFSFTEANCFYRVLVYAKNSAGASAGTVTGYFYGPPSAPGTPVTSRSLNSTTVNVSWAAGASPGYTRTYILDRSLNGGAWTQIATTNGLAYTDTIAVGSTAHYRVRAVTPIGVNQGASVYSATSAVSASGQHWTVPNAPVLVLNLTGASTATVGISGNQNNPSLDKYWQWIDWQYSVNANAFGGGGTGLAGTTTVINTTGLAANSRHRYQVRSRNVEGGPSAWTIAAAVYTKPNAPSSFTAERASAGSSTVNFTWVNNAAWPNQYLIEKSTDDGLSWSQIIATQSNGAAATTQSISQAARYRMRVNTPAPSMLSDYSAEVAVGVAFVSDRTKMLLGSSQIDYIYVGTQRVRRVYRGTSVVWEDGDA